MVPDQNLVRSVKFCRIQIRIRIQSLPIRIWIQVRERFDINSVKILQFIFRIGPILFWLPCILISYKKLIQALKNLGAVLLCTYTLNLLIIICPCFRIRFGLTSRSKKFQAQYHIKCTAHNNNPRWQNFSPSGARPPRSYRDPQNTRRRSSAPACWPPRSQTGSPRKCRWMPLGRKGIWYKVSINLGCKEQRCTVVFIFMQQRVRISQDRDSLALWISYRSCTNPFHLIFSTAVNV